LQIEEASRVMVCTVSLYEIGQKVRLGRWPDMDTLRQNALANDTQSGIEQIAVSGEIALQASRLDWDNRDPFDRLIAACARAMKAELVSRDAAFDAIADLGRLWG
jgi:PIN domain nuclease of toxin-antitoxin system